jgi:SAM-dependent methyltransferase
MNRSDPRHSHDDLVRDQFTKQAVPFAESPAVQDAEALRILVEAAGAGADDTVLDVACGPGHVACAFARTARRVTGIDLTPAMVEKAGELARREGLANVSFQVGPAVPLPFADGAFRIVVTRYALHHLPDPRAALAEMRRVCVPGGVVVVADVVASPDPEKAAAYNRMEKIRDPSHVRALTPAELAGLLDELGLHIGRTAHYGFPVELDGLLKASFPAPGGAEEVRRVITESLVDGSLGIPVRRLAGGISIELTYPIAVLVAGKPAV